MLWIQEFLPRIKPDQLGLTDQTVARQGSEKSPALARFRIAAQAHSSVRSTHLQHSLKVPDARLYIARDRVCSARISQAR
jgi:hypothetical protein